MASVILFRPIYDPYTRSVPTTPWGLLHVAAPLVDRGVDVNIVDECCTPDYQEKVLELDRTKPPVAVGISTMTGVQLRFALQFARFVREHTDAPIVWGGVHPSILPEQTARHELADYVVAGEGEYAFAQLVDRLAQDRVADEIPGVFMLRDGKIHGTKAADFIDLATLPTIPYLLLDIERYICKRPDLGVDRFFEICTSRGCPHHCGFCYIESVHKSRWRCLDAETVLEPLKLLVDRFRIDGVLFREDNFFVNRKRVEAVARGIIDRGITVKWSASCRIDYFVNYDSAFVDLLRRSGCVLLTFGVESGSDRLLEYAGKGITVDMALEAVHRVKESGIRGSYHFMGGLPTETDEELVATCRLIEKVRAIAPDTVVREMAMFTPYPGVRLAQACIESGYREPDHLEGWTDMDWKITRRPWITDRHARLISDVQFLVARLAHPNPVLRAWANWRWKQLLKSDRGIALPERPAIDFGRKLTGRA